MNNNNFYYGYQSYKSENKGKSEEKKNIRMKEHFPKNRKEKEEESNIFAYAKSI